MDGQLTDGITKEQGAARIHYWWTCMQGIRIFEWKPLEEGTLGIASHRLVLIAQGRGANTGAPWQSGNNNELANNFEYWPSTTN